VLLYITLQCKQMGPTDLLYITLHCKQMGPSNKATNMKAVGEDRHVEMEADYKPAADIWTSRGNNSNARANAWVDDLTGRLKRALKKDFTNTPCKSSCFVWQQCTAHDTSCNDILYIPLHYKRMGPSDLLYIIPCCKRMGPSHLLYITIRCKRMGPSQLLYTISKWAHHICIYYISLQGDKPISFAIYYIPL
jgi:hypothetical protein